MQEIVEQLKPSYEGKQAAFLVRIIREIRQLRPLDGEVGNKLPLLNSIIPKLHQIIANETIKVLVPLNIRPNKHSRRTLWEGQPLLPVQPSPAIFKLLRRVSGAMSDTGSDLWSPAASGVAKKILREAVQEDINQWSTEQVNGTENEVATEDGKDESSDHANDVDDANAEALVTDGEIQTCFDLCYLDCALGSAKEDAERGTLLSSFGPNTEEARFRILEQNKPPLRLSRIAIPLPPTTRDLIPTRDFPLLTMPPP